MTERLKAAAAAVVSTLTTDVTELTSVVVQLPAGVAHELRAALLEACTPPAAVPEPPRKNGGRGVAPDTSLI